MSRRTLLPSAPQTEADFDNYYNYAATDYNNSPPPSPITQVGTPEHDDGNQSGSLASSAGSTKSSTKRSSRHRNNSAEALSRRRAQNRESQRAYRERKNQRIRELEEQLAVVSSENEHLSSACRRLREEFAGMPSAMSFTEQLWTDESGRCSPADMVDAVSQAQLRYDASYLPPSALMSAMPLDQTNPENWKQVWDWWQLDAANNAGATK